MKGSPKIAGEDSRASDAYDIVHPKEDYRLSFFVRFISLEWLKTDIDLTPEAYG